MVAKRTKRRIIQQKRLSFSFNSQKKWLKNANDVKEYRELLIKQQNGLCAVTQEPLISPVVDHDHLNFNTRGCLSSFVNMVEGRYFKYFMKYVQKHTALTYPEFLIKLGEYLNNDFSNNPWHFMSIDKIYKRLNYLTLPSLRAKIEKEFGDVQEDLESLDKNQLRMLYCNLIIKQKEKQID